MKWIREVAKARFRALPEGYSYDFDSGDDAAVEEDAGGELDEDDLGLYPGESAEEILGETLG